MDIAPAVIDVDLPCIECGYNLRGLDPTGRCPECGSDIARSRRGDLLRFANPRWLRRVKLGADLMLLAILAGTLGGIAVSWVAVLLGAMTFVWTMMFSLSASALQLAAIFLITTQEPRTTLSEGELTWRKAIRAMAIAQFVLQSAAQSGFMFSAAPLVLLGSAAGVMGVVILFGYFTYAENFAHRIPDAALARSTRTVKWGLAVCACGTVLGSVVFGAAAGGLTAFAGGATPAATTATAAATATMPAPPFLAGGAAAFALLAGILGVGFLVFSIWALALLARYRRALRLAIRKVESQHADIFRT